MRLISSCSSASLIRNQISNRTRNQPLPNKKENTMAVTTLDPKTALILVDLQKGIVAYPTVHPIGECSTPARWPMHSVAIGCRWCLSTSPVERRDGRNRRAHAGSFPPIGPILFLR